MREATVVLGTLAERYEAAIKQARSVEDRIEVQRVEPVVHTDAAQLPLATPPITERELHQLWWRPVVEMQLDDPNQQSPRLYWKNNVRVPMLWPGTWLTAWHNERPDGVCGVALSGKDESVDAFWRKARRIAAEIRSELPVGATVDQGRFGIGLVRSNSDFLGDDERREWIKATLN